MLDHVVLISLLRVARTVDATARESLLSYRSHNSVSFRLDFAFSVSEMPWSVNICCSVEQMPICKLHDRRERDHSPRSPPQRCPITFPLARNVGCGPKSDLLL